MGQSQKKITYEQYLEIERQLKVEQKFEYFRITGYIPHEEQEKVHRSTAQHRVLVAGRRSGKSKAAAKELEYVLLEPGTLSWVGAPTYVLTDKIFREVYKEIVIKGMIPQYAYIKKSENDRIIKVGWDAEGNFCGDKEKAVITSEIVGKSTDNPDSLLGEGLDFLVYDECAKDKPSIWQKYLSPTLADRDGRVLFLTTPEGQNWVHGIYKMGLSSARTSWESFHFATSKNPHISREYLKEKEITLPEEVFDQEYKALFTAFKGQVFKNLTEASHGISKKDYPEFTRVRVALDFGYTNPTAILVVADDSDGRSYVIEELYKTRMLKEDIVEVVRDIKERYGSKFAGGIADSNDPEKCAALTQFGVMGAYKDKDSVKKGILAVAKKVKIQPDGRPRLYIDHDCVHCWSELPNYKYKEQVHTNPAEEPTKKDDHTCDALRYLLYSDDSMIKDAFFNTNALDV
jgi:hypothetical protein